jgi:hypothetical protein
MPTTPLTFETAKSLVDTFDAVEAQLVAALDRVRRQAFVARQLLQNHICEHRNTTTERDSSDYHRSRSYTVCDDCDKWL